MRAAAARANKILLEKSTALYFYRTVLTCLLILFALFGVTLADSVNPFIRLDPYSFAIRHLNAQVTRNREKVILVSSLSTGCALH